MITSEQTSKAIGTRGEILAMELLASKGYAIVDQNVHIADAELDIIAQFNARLVIVEVKTRKYDHEDSDFAIDRQKINRLARGGAAYLKSKNLPLDLQIDAVLIVNMPDGSYTIDHLEDIALPPMRRRR